MYIGARMTEKQIIEDIFNHSWKDGWQLDLEYMLPRVVFHKKSSTCYMYNAKDFDDHLRTCGLTNLEYLEGKLFYREHCMQLLTKRMENRIPVDEQKGIFSHNIAFHSYSTLKRR
jgi:hypothetical protein